MAKTKSFFFTNQETKPHFIFISIPLFYFISNTGLKIYCIYGNLGGYASSFCPSGMVVMVGNTVNSYNHC